MDLSCFNETMITIKSIFLSIICSICGEVFDIREPIFDH